MNNILIVGNGYDLACGLKSKLSDFFNPLLSRYLFQLNENVEQTDLKEELSVLYQHIFDRFIKESDYKKYLNEDEIHFFESDLSKLLIKKFYPHFWVFIKCLYIERSKFVVNFSFESKIPSNKDSDENDLLDKRELNKILEKVCKEIDIVDYSDVSWFDVEDVITSIVKEETIQPLSSLMKQDDVDSFNEALHNFELGALYQDPSDDKQSHNNNLEYDINSCLEGLNLFKKLFTEYLTKEQSRFFIDKDSNKNILEQKYNKIISLNYTKLFKQSLISQSEDNVCYIHGNIEEENIVIGTESFYFSENSRDDTNITNVPFFKFFQRVLNKTDDKYLSWINSSEFFNLTFFGFSFSQNDFDLIRELVAIDDKLIRPNLQSITIYCYKKSDKYNCLVNLATCLGKKLLLSLKKKLEFKVLN